MLPQYFNRLSPTSFLQRIFWTTCCSSYSFFIYAFDFNFFCDLPHLTRRTKQKTPRMFEIFCRPKIYLSFVGLKNLNLSISSYYECSFFDESSLYFSLFSFLVQQKIQHQFTLNEYYANLEIPSFLVFNYCYSSFIISLNLVKWSSFTLYVNVTDCLEHFSAINQAALRWNEVFQPPDVVYFCFNSFIDFLQTNNFLDSDYGFGKSECSDWDIAARVDFLLAIGVNFIHQSLHLLSKSIIHYTKLLVGYLLYYQCLNWTNFHQLGRSIGFQESDKNNSCWGSHSENVEIEIDSK